MRQLTDAVFWPLDRVLDLNAVNNYSHTYQANALSNYRKVGSSVDAYLTGRQENYFKEVFESFHKHCVWLPQGGDDMSPHANQRLPFIFQKNKIYLSDLNIEDLRASLLIPFVYHAENACLFYLDIDGIIKQQTVSVNHIDDLYHFLHPRYQAVYEEKDYSMQFQQWIRCCNIQEQQLDKWKIAAHTYHRAQLIGHAVIALRKCYFQTMYDQLKPTIDGWESKPDIFFDQDPTVCSPTRRGRRRSSALPCNNYRTVFTSQSIDGVKQGLVTQLRVTDDTQAEVARLHGQTKLPSVLLKWSELGDPNDPCYSNFFLVHSPCWPLCMESLEDNKEKKIALIDLALVLRRLSGHGWALTDVKPSNIFVDYWGRAVISDLKSLVYLHSDSYGELLCTPAYSPKSSDSVECPKKLMWYSFLITVADVLDWKLASPHKESSLSDDNKVDYIFNCALRDKDTDQYSELLYQQLEQIKRILSNRSGSSQDDKELDSRPGSSTGRLMFSFLGRTRSVTSEEEKLDVAWMRK